MGFLGVILFLLLIWILILVVMSVFAILCIIFSATSVSKAKQFFASRQYFDYRKSRGRFIAALVFFILTCLTSVGGLVSLEVLLDGSITLEELLDPGTLLFFVVPPALLITAVALGIRCFVWHSRASKFHMQMSMASATVQYYSKAQPQYFSTAPGYKVCPFCGTSNNEVNSFCVKCGRGLQ